MKVHIEVTDTFGGEANYAWVRRYILTLPMIASDLAVVRQTKKLIGWTHKRCVRETHGDMLVLRPQGECVVCFITFD